MSSQSKSLPYDQGEHKTTEELIQDFCRDLEKGDFGLSKLIKYGYILYGQTRSGKTASGHLLSGNALKGVKIGGDEKVQIVTSKNKNAKIGNTSVSQTRVPNIFEIKDPNNPEEKVCVIDTPGYGDTYGTFRILGNGYYHYRLYSNVQNMKFILCFDQIQLKNTAELFIDTIIRFTEYFKDYKEHRHEIWKSCVFLINKVDESSSNLKDIKSQISAIQKSIKLQRKQDEIDLIKEFIRYIVDEDRIFTIKKYKSGESATRADLLKAIDSKITWWSRQLNPDKQEDEVDMSPIMFNITKPILVELTRNQLSKQEFIQLIKYYNQRVNQILEQYKAKNQESCSLDFVFNQIVKDAMGHPDSHNFLNIMKRYVDKYYHIYDPQYKDQREKLQKELFAANTQSQQPNMSNPSKGTKIKDKNFLVKKFNFLQNINQKKNFFNQMFNNTGINNQWNKKIASQKISQMTKGLYEMIKEFNNISYKKKNRTQIVYKYGYMIYRVISEVQVLLLLIQGASEKKQGDNASKNKILDAADNNFFVLNRPLTDFMGLNYSYQGQQNLSFQELRQKFIKKVDLNSDQFKQVRINWSLIDLFSSTELNDDPQVVQKIIILLEKFSEQFLQQRQTKQQNRKDTLMLIQRLTVARVNCSQLYELTQDLDRKSQYFFLMRRITDNIGKLLIIVKKYQLARQVYDSIMYVDSVCDLFEQQIKLITIQQGKKSRTNQNNPYTLRIQYANYLTNHGREKKAIFILQQAFELAINKIQLQEIRVLLNDSMLQKVKDDSKDSYEQNLFQNKLFENFDDDLINKLQSLVAQSMPSSQIMM